MKEKIINLWNSGAVHIIIGTFATKFATLFGTIFIVRIMSKNDYGILSYIDNLYSFVFLLGGLGIANGTLRYVVLGKTLEEKKGYYDFTFTFGIISNVIIILIMTLVNCFYNHPNAYQDAKYLLIILLFSLPFQYSIENNLATERAFFSNKSYAFLSFFYALLLVVAKIVGAFFQDLYGVIFATVIINIIICVFTTIIVKKAHFKNIKAIFPDRDNKKHLLGYSMQYMLVNGLWMLLMLSDVFLLGIMGTAPAELADYKIAYVWPANISIVGTCIATYVTPYFIKNEHDLDWIRRNFAIVFAINFLITAAIAIFMFVFSKPLILLYAGKKYLNTIGLMRMLLLASVINTGLRMITANTFSAVGKVKYNMIVSLIGFIAQILLNVFFIPRIGVYSVVYTSIFIYSFMSISLLIIFVKQYYINSNHER